MLKTRQDVWRSWVGGILGQLCQELGGPVRFKGWPFRPNTLLLRALAEKFDANSAWLVAHHMLGRPIADVFRRKFDSKS